MLILRGHGGKGVALRFVAQMFPGDGSSGEVVLDIPPFHTAGF